MGTIANADGLCDHEDAVVCPHKGGDGNSDTMVKVTADINVGLLRRKEEDD